MSTTTDSTPLTFLYLSEPDAIAAGVTDMAACVDAMEETLTLLATGDYRMAGADGDSHGAMVTFPKTSTFPGMPVDGPDRRFMAMPAYLGGSFGTAGVKWYGSNVGNRDQGLPRSLHLFTLSDRDTGVPLMVMSANLLSAYRTGAIPGVGARRLARPDATDVCIVGPGVMGRTGLESYLAVLPELDTLRIVGRGRANAEKFAAWASSKFPQLRSVTICDSVQEGVRGADVIHVGASTPPDVATYPYLASEWLKPGAFVCSVANTRMDNDLLTGSASLFVDNLGLYTTWAEEYPYPTWEVIGIIGCRFTDLVHERKLTLDDITQIGDVLLGSKPGRTSEDEIIVYSVGGMPIEDVAWATQVYRRARRDGIGTELLIWDEPEMA